MNSDLSEEEIIEIVKEIKNHQVAFFDPIEHKQILRNYFPEKQRNAIQGLLDLYQKEKTRNASMKKEIKLMKSININDNFISKELLESYKKELEEIKKNLKSIHNTAFIDFGITLLDHILKGENK